MTTRTRRTTKSPRFTYEVRARRLTPAVKRLVKLMIRHLAKAGAGAESWSPEDGGILVRKAPA